MRPIFLNVFIVVLALAGGLLAQTPTPSPQLPDDLKGVPVVAPDYRSDERTLPEIGRVGVDLMQQKALTLREAIETAIRTALHAAGAREVHIVTRLAPAWTTDWPTPETAELVTAASDRRVLDLLRQ